MATRRKTKKADRLDVFMNSTRVGQLVREANGAVSFTYHPDWLGRKNPLPISRQLPLQETAFIGQLVRNYFDNLLPDDPRIRESLAVSARASGTQPFDLLAAIGRDCVGALQFYPEGAQPDPIAPARGKSISDTQIAKIIRNLRVNPLGFSAEMDFRISLAGAQSKTALLQKDGKWFLPKGATPTTHIIKPAIGATPEGPDLSLSVENEWLCLKLLRAFGLDAADATITEFENLRVLVIKRFDRQWAGKKLFRLPQEDMCQALGLGPEMKYESDGGPGIGHILSFFNESDRRDEDRKNFMKAQLIYWLLAAVDGHAKNFSVFIRPGGFLMTPLYDVMSADPHINPKSFQKQKIKLAMAVGNNRHYSIEKILPRHWRQTADKYKFLGIDELMVEIAQLAPRAIEKANRELPRGFPPKISEPIFHAILTRAKKLA
jgi:serine/threonine-protein kinase HipA